MRTVRGSTYRCPGRHPGGRPFGAGMVVIVISVPITVRRLPGPGRVHVAAGSPISGAITPACPASAIFCPAAARPARYLRLPPGKLQPGQDPLTVQPAVSRHQFPDGPCLAVRAGQLVSVVLSQQVPGVGTRQSGEHQAGDQIIHRSPVPGYVTPGAFPAPADQASLTSFRGSPARARTDHRGPAHPAASQPRSASASSRVPGRSCGRDRPVSRPPPARWSHPRPEATARSR